ncbi:EF2563 family selenium-dependent molybdenum hydroxylase system protein [Erwinia sp. CPCC 100877]|nr:EF2563 family selenium-dependent molybdenum hydroxylase system protein [Erwinia sp. CPCC 100877]
MGKTKQSITNPIIIVRGGGDLATGVVQKLYHAGFKVVVLETEKPLAIRRTVALCNAVFEGTQQVEDVTGCLATFASDCEAIWQKDQIPILIDPKGEVIESLQPLAVVDAILAKKNLGTVRTMAPITLALGPGFSAPDDVDAVIETMRGHYLGRLYFSGSALPNTGVPGEIGGKSAERVVHSPATGKVTHIKSIGATVKKGEVLFYVGVTPVLSPLDGVLRGLISDQVMCHKGLKCVDVDPRPVEQVDCFTISDKARALGGAALEAILFLGRKKNLFI